jgi:hypothetical protein
LSWAGINWDGGLLHIHVVRTHFEINDSNQLSYYIDPNHTQRRVDDIDSNYPWVLSSRTHFEINDSNHADYMWFESLIYVKLS